MARSKRAWFGSTATGGRCRGSDRRTGFATPGGARVVSADNGEDALLLVEEGPNSIILDWMMPKLSGIRVCLRLKLGPETRAIPIIMLSARMTK